MNAIRGRVSPSGRLSLPASFRKAAGLERGGEVVVELEGRVIRIRPLDEVIARAQAFAQRLAQGRDDASVDAFIAERRKEAERE